MRQTIKDKDYLEYAINDRAVYVSELQEHITTNNPVVANWAYIYKELYYAQLRLFFLKYSLGEPVAELKELALSAIKNYLVAENHEVGNPEAFKSYIGIYGDAMRLTCLAVIYDSLDLLQQLKSSFERNNKGDDLILDVLFVNALNEGTLSHKLCYPEIFDDLVPLSENDKEITNMALKKYLDCWYDKMKKTEWYNLHKKSKLNGASPFYGYWSIEAAALVKLFGLDVELFKDYEYFPYDLATI